MSRVIPINSCCAMAGTAIDADAVYDLSNKIGLSVMEMHMALYSGQEEQMQKACAEIAVLANRASVISAHLERKLAAHRRRTTGVR